jgi:arylsulfatase A-like enzyme
MKRCERFLAVVIGAGLMTAGCTGEPERAVIPDFSDGSRRPNVLIVLVDALRRDHLGAYGYPLPTSPAIDAFAAGSVRFDRAYSHSTWTKPSVATLFTSVYPEQHGLGRVGFEDESGFRTDVLPKRLVTVAERFRRAGYLTGKFGTNVHIQKKTGFGQGFDEFFSQRLVTAFDLNGIFQEWLENVALDAGEPFFAYVHYMDIHWPYNRRLPDETGRFGSTEYEPAPPEHWTAVDSWASEHLNETSLAAIVASYDEELAYVDRAFGELLDWLDERGVLDETVLVFLADHGEGFDEHGELQHGFEPWEEVTGIPLIVRVPSSYRIEPGARDVLVGLIDVAPTVLDLVGLEPPRRFQGRSVVPALLGESLRERPVYLAGDGVRGLRSTTYTFFVSADGDATCFDNLADASETTPLEPPLPEACDQLRTALDGLVAQFELVSGGEGDETVTMDAEEVEALRALGYLD